jgi:hypothetical protein
MPPTSIDTDDITGATIDNQEVQEITVDGDTVFTAAPSTPVRDADLHYWLPFRGTINDEKGNLSLTSSGITLQASGGADDPYTGGDGDDSRYYQFGNGTEISTTSAGTFINEDRDITTMIWAKISGGNNGKLFTASRDFWRIFYDDSADEILFQKFDGSFPDITFSNPAKNTWTHYAFQWDKSASQAEAYVDGSSVGTMSVGYDVRPDRSMRIGSDFPGDLDDFRHYRALLSSSEISQIYNNTDPN